MSRNGKNARRTVRCAIYTRKSTEEGLQQEFNSLDAQREAGEAYIASQKAEGWVCRPDRYDDGGFTGGNVDRPGVQRLLADIEAGKVDCVVVYKVDRLSRSLMDFARMMGTFEKQSVSFVSVTQQFNTTHSMGRLTLNILLSFAQFEREIISERTRDKIAASRRKGKWSGGRPILGYDVAANPRGNKLAVNETEAAQVREIFDLYLQKQSLLRTVTELNSRGWTTKRWTARNGREQGGRLFDKPGLLHLLTNVLYIGRVRYHEETFDGEHDGILDREVFDRVGAMLRSNGRTGGMHIRNKHGALLKGLLRCRACELAMGHSYTVKKGKRAYRYYVCYGAQKRGWDSCPSKSLPAERIEQFVVERIKALAHDPTLLSATFEQARALEEEHLAALRAEQQVVQRELAALYGEIRAVAADADTNGHAAARLADLNDRVRRGELRGADLETQIAETEGGMISHEEVDAALRSFDPLWQTLSPREQARVLRLLVRQVEYDGAGGKLAITFRPGGLQALAEQRVEAMS